MGGTTPLSNQRGVIKDMPKLLLWLYIANIVMNSANSDQLYFASFDIGSTVCPGPITKTCLFKYTENFTTKNWKFSDKISDIFYISAQNTDCGYSLEPPRWGGSNEYPHSMFLSRNKKKLYTPYKPQFYYIKGVKINMFSWWFVGAFAEGVWR